ncbi:hypothetical protein DL96DRAFT_1590994 [Flagelloscypha sp. PMI_526]|nr:hypothetical protein DL96DRAFT_1590994 [Flagelloscypha sp. PMI_526]
MAPSPEQLVQEKAPKDMHNSTDEISPFKYHHIDLATAHVHTPLGIIAIVCFSVIFALVLSYAIWRCCTTSVTRTPIFEHKARIGGASPRLGFPDSANKSKIKRSSLFSRFKLKKKKKFGKKLVSLFFAPSSLPGTFQDIENFSSMPKDSASTSPMLPQSSTRSSKTPFPGIDVQNQHPTLAPLRDVPLAYPYSNIIPEPALVLANMPHRLSWIPVQEPGYFINADPFDLHEDPFQSSFTPRSSVSSNPSPLQFVDERFEYCVLKEGGWRNSAVLDPGCYMDLKRG